MSELQIEKGKFYRTRNGKRVGPMRSDGGLFRAESHADPFDLWFYNGQHDAIGDNPLDLVVEWLDEPVAVEPDLRSQLLDAERRCEATHDAVCTSLRVLCESAGLRIPEGKGYDFPVLFGLIHEWVGNKAEHTDPDFPEVPQAAGAANGYYTAVLIPSGDIERISFALSDLACWARGFRAALPRNEFGIVPDGAPMGAWAVTEVNIALKRALEKNS